MESNGDSVEPRGQRPDRGSSVHIILPRENGTFQVHGHAQGRSGMGLEVYNLVTQYMPPLYQWYVTPIQPETLSQKMPLTGNAPVVTYPASSVESATSGHSGKAFLRCMEGYLPWRHLTFISHLWSLTTIPCPNKACSLNGHGSTKWLRVKTGGSGAWSLEEPSPKGA